MKELVISLLESTEKQRVLTSNLIRENLTSLINNKLISIATREKHFYTEDEEHVIASVFLKLKDCDEKFMGAFKTQFGYSTSIFLSLGDDIYQLPSKYFNVCLYYIKQITCMLHRIQGLKKDNGEEGFDGKIYLKITGFDDNAEIEPLPKHAKYFNEFAELNMLDF